MGVQIRKLYRFRTCVGERGAAGFNVTLAIFISLPLHKNLDLSVTRIYFSDQALPNYK